MEENMIQDFQVDVNEQENQMPVEVIIDEDDLGENIGNIEETQIRFQVVEVMEPDSDELGENAGTRWRLS